MNSIVAAKALLRKQLRQERDLIPFAVRQSKSVSVARRLFDLPVLMGAKTVMGFISFASEVDTSLILERLLSHGKLVLVPRIDGARLYPVIYDASLELERSEYGTMEPVEKRTVPAELIDVVLVPGLGFDRRGARIGYGKGFYDKFLQTLPASTVTIGIGFDEQIKDSLPEEDHDQRVEVVVSDSEAIFTKR